jgi:hypothetical protein
MSRPVALLPALFLSVLLAVSGCEPPPPQTGQARADAATLAACRERSDAAYDRTHRDSIYSINSRDSPFSANYTPGLVDRGLPQRYGYETMTRDCVRNTGTETNRSGAAPPEPAKP